MIEISRYCPAEVEGLTIERDGKHGRKVKGVASVYWNGQPGSQFALGPNIVERIAPGAFDHLLDEDVIATRDHDTKLIVGRNKKTLRLWTTSRGLEYEIDLRNTNTSAANDLWADVVAGNIKGSSFKAVVDMNCTECVQWSKEGKTDVLTIKRFDKLRDVSAVAVPAYVATACEAVVRSLGEHNRQTDAIARLAQIKKIVEQYK